MLFSGTKVLVLKSRFDEKRYPNDAVQFFYGEIEPYYIEEDWQFPDFSPTFIQNAANTLIAQDLIEIQPMEAPRAELMYIDFRYNNLEPVTANTTKVAEEEFKFRPLRYAPYKKLHSKMNYMKKLYRSNKRMKR